VPRSALHPAKALFGALALLAVAGGRPSLAQTQPSAAAVATGWYKQSISPTLADDDLARLYASHLLVEEYFTDNLPASRRTSIINELKRYRTTPREVAELCALRLRWQPTDPGVYYINDHVGPIPVHYFVGVPKGYVPNEPRPLILMLPTANAFVLKPKMTEKDVADTYIGWLKDELTKRPGNIVVMPLLHLTDLWGPGYAGMNDAMKPLQDVADRLSIDTRKVYLRGIGMSGHAVWNLGLHYPTYFAAINPLAGGASYDWQRLRAANLRNTLPVVWADASDQDVPVKLSRDMVAQLRKSKVDVVYEETKNVGHTPSPEIDQKLYDVMAARTRDLYPRTVWLRTNRPDVAFNRVDWIQVWQPMDGGQEIRTLFRWSGTGMWSYQVPVVLEAVCDKNTIDITSKNLGSLRILLSREMVDFTKPIKVLVNKKIVFNDLVSESIDTTLKDQLMLGRGWRKYTAAIELDLAPPPPTRPTSRPSPSTRPH
jgi:hypothetical protein